MRKIFLLLAAQCIFISAHCQDTEYSWDTVNFEEPCSYLIEDSSEENLWVIGVPSKNYFDAAFAGMNCISTGLTANYPTDNHSHFDLVLSYFNVEHFPYSVYLEFNHKFDTDAGKDGGYIEVSHDNGASWKNVVWDQSYCSGPADPEKSKNLYSDSDTLFNGEPGFSGNSVDWINTRFGWEYCLVKNGLESQDTMIIRFNFISDDIDTGKEGWMIDDIRLYSTKLSGAVENYNMRTCLVFPNPAHEMLYVKSLIGESISSLRLMNFNGQILKTSQKQDFLPLNDIQKGIYILVVQTEIQSLIQKIVIE